MSTYISTVFKGMAKTRKGRPSIGLQTLIDRAKSAAFFDEVAVKIAEVSPDEALEAAKILTKRPSARQHAEMAAVPALLAPGIQAAGRATKALVDAKKGRLGAAAKAFKDTTRGGLAQAAVGGGLTGMGISMGREGIQTQRAKSTYSRFLRQHGYTD